MSGPFSARRATAAVYRYVKSKPVLWGPAGRVSRRVAASSEGSVVRRLLSPARDRLRGSMRVADVQRITDALSADGVPFLLAGGWGIDALAGRQTRSHDDLDVVVDDYEVQIERAVGALTAIGFARGAEHDRRAWMPRSVTMLSEHRLRVELLSVNWRILAEAFGPEGAQPEDRPLFEAEVFTTGTVGGTTVRCLSADVQLLFHSSFDLKPAMRGDVALLREELGARNPWE